MTSTRGVALKPKPLNIKGNLVMMSASQATETAQPYNEKRHGLFTYFLLEKLKETNGDVTLGELADYVTRQVKRTSAVNGKAQTPTVKVAYGNKEWQSQKLIWP